MASTGTGEEKGKEGLDGGNAERYARERKKKLECLEGRSIDLSANGTLRAQKKEGGGEHEGAAATNSKSNLVRLGEFSHRP